MLVGFGANSQIKPELTQSRILILLDGSSSMIKKWKNGKPKFRAAQEIIMRLMDSVYKVNDQVEFSLRVFGHQHTVEENYCFDTKNEVPFARDNRTQMSLRLDAIHPLGVTPIAYSLREAADNDLLDVAKNAYSIILITDGGESCGGDICDVMLRLIKEKVYFRPYIVSLEEDPELKVTYNCMGDFLQVTRDPDIPVAVNTIVDAFKPVLKLTPTEYKKIQTIAGKTPSILKVNVPDVKVTKPVDTTPKPNVTITVLPRKPEVYNLSRMPYAPLRPVNFAKESKFITVKTLQPDLRLPKPTVEVLPPLPKPDKINSLTYKPLKQAIISWSSDISVATHEPDLRLPAPTIEKPVLEPISKMPLLANHTFRLMTVIDETLKTPNIDLQLPAPKPEIPEKPKLEKLTTLTFHKAKQIAVSKPGEMVVTFVNTDLQLPAPTAEIPEKPKLEKLTALTFHKAKQIPVSKPGELVVAMVNIDYQMPAPKAEIPEKPKLEKLTTLTFQKAKQIPVSKPGELVVTTVNNDLQLPAPKTEIPEKPKLEKLSALTLNKSKLIPVSKPGELVVAMVNIDYQMPVPKTEIPEKPKVEKLTTLAFNKSKPVQVGKPTLVALSTREVDLSLPTATPEIPETPKPGKLQNIPYRRLISFSLNFNIGVAVNLRKPDLTLPAPQTEKEPPAAPDRIVAMKPMSLQRFNAGFVIQEGKFKTRALPELPSPKKEEVVAAKPKPFVKSDILKIPADKRADYNVVTEDAKETTVEVYFTNGHGKFYSTTPVVVLLDQVTNAEIKQFHRTVDANGNPDPQLGMPVGTFNLTFTARRSLVAAGVHIEEKKRNKIYVTVKNTNLSFAYADTNNVKIASTRPVKEYTAIVTERNKSNGKVVSQKCTERIEYEPGNYHIEINTFPTDIRNTDLDFDLETPIFILQPGFIKFTNTLDIKTVGMFRQVGDKFLPFYTWDLNDPRSGHVVIQPGKYTIHYQKGPVKSVYVKETVVEFSILSNRETEVIIK